MTKMLTISSVFLALMTANTFADEGKPLKRTEKGSVIIFGCTDCKTEVEEDEVVLEPGSQVLEVRKVGEEMKIYRTENWLGGSPVSYVHMLPNPDEKMIGELKEGPIEALPAQGSKIDPAPVASIDTLEKPVVAGMAAETAEKKPEAGDVDAISFDLRLE